VDTVSQDVVVMTARVYHREHSFGANPNMATDELFDEYERQLFTKVVELAEKAGKHVSLMVVPTNNVFDGILQTAQRLESAMIITGISNKLTLDEQGKLTGDAWERLPEPRPRVKLQVCEPDGALHEYRLGPHTPRLRREDVDLLHRLWLEASANPDLASLHHYHIVHLALEKFDRALHHSQRDELLKQLKEEMERKDDDYRPPQVPPTVN
jgi:hypothetical protein